MAGIGKVDLSSYPVTPVAREFGNFKVEGKVCGSSKTDHYLTLENTKMDDKSFGFEMSVLSGAQHTQVSMRLAPSGVANSMTVMTPNKEATEYYRGPAVFDEMAKSSDRLREQPERLRSWAKDSQLAPTDVKLVGRRPAESEIGTVTRERKGGLLTVTFEAGQASDAHRQALLFKMGAEALEAGTKNSCQAAFDAVEQMGIMAPNRPSSQSTWKLK